MGCSGEAMVLGMAPYLRLLRLLSVPCYVSHIYLLHDDKCHFEVHYVCCHLASFKDPGCLGRNVNGTPEFYRRDVTCLPVSTCLPVYLCLPPSS